jgi:CheY-like chemotaxis protein
MGARTSILVIDDEPEIGDMVQAILRRAGCDVLVQNNAEDALEWLRKADPLPSLILLDGMLPGMDGWGFLRALAAANLPAVPVILMSALLDFELSRVPSGVQVVGKIEKPFKAKDLLEMVRKGLETAVLAD